MRPRPSRRRLLAALGAATVPAVGPVAGARTIAPGRWTQHGGDGRNTNRTAERGPQLSQETDWVTDLPSVDSAPLVADDTVFLLDISDDGRIHGLHAATGTTRFVVELDESVVSGMLAADGERVYTADVLSPAITAFAIPSGARVWETTLADSGGSGPQLGLGSGFRTAPRLADGRLYLTTRSSEPRGGVVALDAATGAFDGVYEGRFSSFAVGPDRLVGASASPSLSEYGLTCLSVASGEQRFTYQTRGRPGRPTLGAERTVVGTSENRVHAVDGAGDAAWTAPVDGWAVSLTLADEVVLAQTADTLVALDRATGDRRWTAPASDARPVVANGLAYVARAGGFDAYDPGTGELEFSHRDRRLDGPVTQLSVADGSLFAAAPPGLVYAVEERYGRLLSLLR